MPRRRLWLATGCDWTLPPKHAGLTERSRGAGWQLVLRNGGKRAPEVVFGKRLDHIRERQMDKRTTLERELLPLHRGGLPREDLVALLSEQDIPVDTFSTLLELKTDFTHSLPFALAGIGVGLTLRLIDVFDSSNPEAPDRVATPFLNRALVGGYRHALQEWAQYHLPMSNVPSASAGPHAIMKKATIGKKASRTLAGDS